MYAILSSVLFLAFLYWVLKEGHPSASGRDYIRALGQLVLLEAVLIGVAYALKGYVWFLVFLFSGGVKMLVVVVLLMAILGIANNRKRP